MPTLPPELDAPFPTGPLVERLLAWSAINSGSDHVAGLTRMADVLEAALRELTSTVERVPLDDAGRVAVRATLRPDAPVRVLCSGHYDTVYGAAHTFQTPRVVSADKLNGPGVADMKGGIVGMLAALTAFERTGAAHRLGWTILLTPDEETGSETSRPVIEAAARDHDLGLVFEPARDSGAMVRSRAATGIFTLTVHGRAAHAGRDPAAGRNAIVALAELLLAANRLPETIPDLMINVGAIRGGGTVNIVPDHAAVDLNARASTKAALGATETALNDLVAAVNTRDGYRAALTGQFNRDPLQSTPEREALFAALQNCAIALGETPPDWMHVAGGSDGNLLHAAGLPVLDGLGPVGGGLHSPAEYIETATLASRARLATLFLHGLATGEIALPARE